MSLSGSGGLSVSQVVCHRHSASQLSSFLLCFFYLRPEKCFNVQFLKGKSTNLTHYSVLTGLGGVLLHM